MKQPTCIPKLDIRIYEDRVTFSKCCITENINFKNVPIDIIMSLSDAELEDKIFNEYSILENPKELSEKFNCVGTCKGLWNSEPKDIYVSHQFCNYFCSMCRHNIFTSDKKDLIKNCYFKILNALSSSNRNISIGTTTLGEPFIWKNETVDFIKSCNKYVNCTSNLSLLDEDAFTEIENGNFKNVGICGSVDSFNPKIYMQIRRPATEKTAQKVFSNVQRLISLYKSGKIRWLNINIVLSDFNFSYEDIQNTLNFFKENNFTEFRMSNDLHKPDLSFYKVDWFTEELQNQCHFYFAS